MDPDRHQVFDRAPDQDLLEALVVRFPLSQPSLDLEPRDQHEETEMNAVLRAYQEV